MCASTETNVSILWGSQKVAVDTLWYNDIHDMVNSREKMIHHTGGAYAILDLLCIFFFSLSCANFASILLLLADICQHIDHECHHCILLPMLHQETMTSYHVLLVTYSTPCTLRPP